MIVMVKRVGSPKETMGSIAWYMSTYFYVLTMRTRIWNPCFQSEHKETIEALNNEKHKLMMSNSAAITNVQKAEKR
jgi:hypothetical protein